MTDPRGVVTKERDAYNALDAEPCHPSESTLEFFGHYPARWGTATLAERPEEITCVIGLCDDMLNVVREIDSLGFFKPDLNCLCHLDFHPCSIMVEVHPDDTIEIAGVLEGDKGVLAPKLVNCEPPGWLWVQDQETRTEMSIFPWPYELEGTDNTPSTLQQQELKQNRKA